MSSSPTYSLGKLSTYFLKLGTTGFGGPVALVGYMHSDLVEKKKWIAEEDYKEGLALAQLAPGPLAAQLAIYLGYVHHKILGATIAGLAFVIPSFLMVVGLGMAYVHFGGLSWMQAVFYGVSASVIGIIAISGYKLTTKSIGKDWLLWFIFLAAGTVTVITESENVLLFIGAGILFWFLKAPPKFKYNSIKNVLLFPMVSLFIFSADASVLEKIALFFTKAGAFVFGSGLAIVPFLYSGVVKENHWLTDQQFIDAVAVAMITPGPVIITVGFIGYLIAGFSGACVASAATFLPCYLFTVIPAPYFKKYGKNKGLKAFVDGVTAAAIGAIVGAVIILGKKTLTDIPTVILAVTTAGILFSTKKIPEPVIVLVAAFTGIMIKHFIK